MASSLPLLELQFVDFIPKELKKTGWNKPAEFEPFHKLVDRLNEWLQTNIEFKVISCETITSFGGNRKQVHVDSYVAEFDLYPDNENSYRLDTWALHILRAWIVPRPANEPTQKLGYVNIHSECWTTAVAFLRKLHFSSLDVASQHFSEKLARQEVSTGKLLNVNTFIHWIRYMSEFDPDKTYFDLLRFDHQVQCLRAFYEVGTPGPDNLSFIDFTPMCVKERKSFLGTLRFETLTEVFHRAKEWVSEQNSQNKIEIINIECVHLILPILPKDGTFVSTHVPFGANSMSDSMKFIRIHYVSRHEKECYQLPPPYPMNLNYNISIPAQVSPGGFMKHAKYEYLPDTVNRMCQNLNFTFQQIIGILTLNIPNNRKYPPKDGIMYSDQISGNWLRGILIIWND